MTPKVTVITPAYNRLDLLPKTLDSVLSQKLNGDTFSDLEYIVVDDGSTDGTYEWLLSLKHKRLKVLNHSEHQNCGQSASINLGLSQARGDFIVILDSDDILAQGAIDCHLRIMEKNSDLGMVYGQGFAIDINDQNLYPLFSESHYEDSDPNRLLLNCYITSPGLCMFRKRVIDRIGLLEQKFRAAQDHDFLLRVAEKSRIAYSRHISFYYRKHEGSISVNGQLTRWKNGFEILQRATKRYPYKNSTIRKRKAVLCFRLGMVMMKGGHRANGIRYLLQSGMFDPLRALKVLVGRDTAR